MHRRLTRVVAATAAALLMPAAAAHADGAADASYDSDGVATTASNNATNAGGVGGGHRRSSGETCTYQALDGHDSAIADKLAAKGWGSARGEGPGTWYRKICTSDADGETATVVWVRARRVDHRALADEAADRASIPLPAIRLSPPVGADQVVNVPTWLSIDTAQWRPVTSSATAGTVTATATAVPESVTWSMGNGDTVSCAGPGTPYQRGGAAAGQQPDCSYTYRGSSARAPGGTFTLAATVSWRVSWVATGAPGGGVLGTVTRTSQVPVRVAEIQALNR